MNKKDELEQAGLIWFVGSLLALIFVGVIHEVFGTSYFQGCVLFACLSLTSFFWFPFGCVLIGILLAWVAVTWVKIWKFIGIEEFFDWWYVMYSKFFDWLGKLFDRMLPRK